MHSDLSSKKQFHDSGLINAGTPLLQKQSNDMKEALLNKINSDLKILIPKNKKQFFYSFYKLLEYGVIAVPTATAYVITNKPILFDEVNAAAINIILNGKYVPETIQGLRKKFTSSKELPAKDKKNFSIILKVIIGVLSLVGALGSSMSGYNGMKTKIDDLYHEKNILIFLHVSNILNLVVNSLLYFSPIYEDISGIFKNTNDPQFEESLNFIGQAISYTRDTESSPAMLELDKLIENIHNSDQDLIRTLKNIFFTRQSNYPELYKKVQQNRIGGFIDKAVFVHSLFHCILPRLANFSVILLSDLALTPATRAGILALTGYDITEWGAAAAVLPEAYFLGQNVEKGTRVILDTCEKFINRLKSSISDPSERGKHAASLLTIVSVLGGCAYLAWRSVSTMEEQVASSPVDPLAHYQTAPVSYLIDQFTPILKPAMGIAITAGAALANFRAIFTVTNKAIDGLRTYCMSTQTDKKIKELNKIENLGDQTALIWAPKITPEGSAKNTEKSIEVNGACLETLREISIS